MLFSNNNPQNKRLKLRELLRKDKLLRFPGSFSPLISMMIEDLGFDGVYISGAVLSNDLGLPDIGLTTLTEVSMRGRSIASATNLPSLIDIDTGFGEVVNVARTINEVESLGLSGCHIEDQVLPKRCGHLNNKVLVNKDDMVKKIKCAVRARQDESFLLIARTDARTTEGLESAIERAKSYVDAGADAIFPEALQDEKEFETFRKQINIPLLANMTEFGKSKLLTYDLLNNLGYNIVIYPVTALRLALYSVQKGLQSILDEGSQQYIIDQMMTRKELYRLIQYEKYSEWDENIYNI